MMKPNNSDRLFTKPFEVDKQTRDSISKALEKGDFDEIASICAKKEDGFKYALYKMENVLRARTFNLLDNHLEDFCFIMNNIERVEYHSIKRSLDRLDFIKTKVTNLYYNR